jgi:hypothetical protein
MSEDEPEVVVLAAKILARLIIVHGNHYNKKLSDKTGGYTVMQHRLKRWWNVPLLWPICFAILFGLDVAHMDLDRPFDHFAFVDLFLSKGDVKIVFPEIFPVMAEMLQSGLKKTVATSGGPLRQGSTPGAVQQRQPSLHRHSMSSTSPSSEFSFAIVSCILHSHFTIRPSSLNPGQRLIHSYNCGRVSCGASFQISGLPGLCGNL